MKQGLTLQLYSVELPFDAPVDPLLFEERLSAAVSERLRDAGVDPRRFGEVVVSELSLRDAGNDFAAAAADSIAQQLLQAVPAKPVAAGRSGVAKQGARR